MNRINFIYDYIQAMWCLVRNHLQKNNNIFPQMRSWPLQPQEKVMYVQVKVRGAEAYTYFPPCRIFIYPPLFVDAFLSSYTEVNVSL